MADEEDDTGISRTGGEDPSVPQPRTREELVRYWQQITLDPNTVHRHMSLLDDDRRVAYSRVHQPYPDHPDRFTRWYQVLSRESLTGRCYFEVEWAAKGGVDIAVTYKDIGRAGSAQECVFGLNHKSWALYCNPSCFHFRHDGVRTPVSGPRSSRVGVYLDHGAGVLSFYSVSGTMTLLHRVQTAFSQPLLAGVSVGESVEFLKPQEIPSVSVPPVSEPMRF